MTMFTPEHRQSSPQTCFEPTAGTPHQAWRTSPALIGALAPALMMTLGACSGGPTAPDTRISIQELAEGYNPAISGDRVAWQRFTGGPLLVQDLATGQRRVLARGPDTGQVDFPAISGSRAAWMLRFVVEPGFSPIRIALGDVAGEDTTIVSGPDIIDRFPDISPRYVVWQRRGEDDSDILGYDMETGEILPVATGPTFDTEPAVDGERVVFTRRIIVDNASREIRRDIYLFDFTTGETRRLNPNEGPLQGNPDISGDIAVWADNTDGSGDIVYRNLSTGRFVNVTEGGGGGGFPAISGSLIAWSDTRNSQPGQEGLDENLDIFAFDIETGLEIPITTAPGLQDHPDVSGNRVVWEDWSKAPARVFIAEIER